MSWIDEIEISEADGPLADIYKDLVEKRGKVSNVLKVHSLNPEAMSGHLGLYMTLMFGRSGLSRAEREAIGVVVSAENDCAYCVNHHVEALKNYIKDEGGKTASLPSSSGNARYMLPMGAILLVEEGDVIKAGDVLSKLPRATTKTKDITGGLPRVAELFEVRKPKEISVLSQIDGYVSISKGTKKGKQKVTITPVDVGESKSYLIPKGKHINVYEGDYVRAGEPLIGGAANPQDILKIKGEVALAKYLVGKKLNE